MGLEGVAGCGSCVGGVVDAYGVDNCLGGVAAV